MDLTSSGRKCTGDAAKREAQPTVDVSLVIPVFNRAELLARALKSVNVQRRAPAEVIVVDDGSTDGSAEVAARCGARVLAHGVNRGQVASRNTGISAATQPWVAFLDSDDEWLPDHLEELWKLRQGMSFVASSSINCRNGPIEDRVVGPLTNHPVVLRDPWRLIHPMNFITMSTSMVRRDVMITVGGFNSHDGIVEDLDLWVRLLERGPARVSPRVTVIYHVHGAQITDDLPRTRNAHMSAAIAYLQRSGRSPALIDRQIGAQAWDQLRDALDDRRWDLVRRHALRMVASTGRVRGVLELLAWRMRARRASAGTRRDGGPTVVLLDALRRERAMPEGLNICERADLHGLGYVQRLWALLRRPAGVSVVASRVDSLAARALGIPTVEAADCQGGARKDGPVT